MHQSTELKPVITGGVNRPDQESMLSSLSRQLSAIEKRDFHLWMMVLIISVIISAGLLMLIFPATFFPAESLHFELTMSKEVFFGLVAFVVVFNLYAIYRRFEYRRTRQELISSTIQNELIRLQSFTDPLTEVYNRRSLTEMANRYINHAHRSKTPLTFLMVDIDRFKEVNSRFGHLTGDVVLAEVAAVLRNCVRGSDTVVRFGGDEFLILLSETNTRGAQTVVQRIEHMVEDWNQKGQLKGFVVTLSIGASEWRENSSFESVLDEADREMFLHKKAVGG